MKVMKKGLDNRRTERLFLLAIGIIAALMLFANLGNQYLWQDEAQTALISKTILSEGVPRGYDGLNFFSQELGANYGENYIWKWHPWLPFYVLAGFFKLFGISTFVARLPFALMGLGTILLTYHFGRDLFNDRRVGAAAAVLLTFSVPFLLLAKQCRYYSPAIFFSLLGMYGYLMVLKGKRYGSIVFFLSAVLLFHTNFIYCATMLLATSVHVLLFYRGRLPRIYLLSLGIVVVNIPWIIWFSSAEYGRATELSLNFRGLTFARYFLFDMGRYVFTPFLLIVPLLIAGFNRIKARAFFPRRTELLKELLLPVFFIVTTLATLSIVSPAPFFRYLGPIIPPLMIVAALIIASAMNIHIIAGVVITAALILLNPVPRYLYELTHDYDGPLEGIARYLNKFGSKDDTVAITYGDLPIKFYTPMRVVGGLTGEDLRPGVEADWIIMRRYVISTKDAAVRRHLAQNVDWRRYQKITIDYPEIPFENRETPSEHKYRTEKDAERVVIYKRLGRLD